MRFVDNRGITDARVNLALEEYIFRHKPVEDDVLLFYINAPAIIVGRNQNTIEEINAEIVADRGIHVVRRVSGGGAVYHDLGNLNFSVMTPQVKGRFNHYEHFTGPVIKVLRDLGVPAELSGRNDILAGGRKISGNAQFASLNRMFSHGTLLFDSNLDDVTAALRPRPGKVESKGVKSVRSRVANIREFLQQDLTVDELRLRILEGVFGTSDLGSIPAIQLSEEDWEQVLLLVETRYGTWDWNFGENPPANVRRSERFPAGEVDAWIDVQGGRISAIRLYGDFMGERTVNELESRLVGIPYDREEVAKVLAASELRSYFGEIQVLDLLNLLVG